MDALLLHPGPVPLDALQQALRTHLPDVPLRVWPDIGDPGDIGWALVSRIEAGVLAALPRLRLVGSLHAGVDRLLAPGGVPRHVPLTRPVPGPAGDMLLNEYVLAQVLLHHRDGVGYLQAQRQRRWSKRAIVAAADRCVGFLGHGAMAAPAAALLRRVGFPVVAWARRPRADAGVHCGTDGLHGVLAQSQILVNLLPLTPATRDIVDATLLARLPAGAAFINVGRGEHVVEADLLAALDAGHLAGATLDVFRDEPLPADSPLWSHPGIVVTPHACRRVDVAAVVAQFAAEVARVAAGAAPLHAVDRDAGY